MSRFLPRRRWWFLWAIFAVVLLTAARPALASDNTPAPTGEFAKGQRVFVCGHSFHVFVAQPLEALAREAGRRDHKTLGVFFIGGSYPMQHWDTPDEKNTAKAALATGRVDVLTLAPNRTVPDPGVDLFADLAFEKNPAGRVIIQFSWLPKDDRDDHKTNEDFDKADEAAIATLDKLIEDYLVRQRGQIKSLNERHGREFVFLVPVGRALMRLRRDILAGNAPGLTRQSQLFADAGGHPAESLKNLAAYMWFAATYHQSPVGLAALDKPGNEDSKKLNRYLEQLAWDTITHEPASGVKAMATVGP